ncbi:MAG: ABC transporter [Leifsonia xyli]|nr:MAG: ABC transporter [Leifsonia xyli]
MSLVVPEIRRSWVAGVNPLAKLVVALLVGVTLVLSIDVVSAGIVVAVVVLLLPFAGVSARQLAVRTSPILVSAVLAGVATALYGVDAGVVLVRLGPITVTEGSLVLAVAILLRVLAVGVPAVLLFATTDPTDLADALAQLARLPARFVLGALAALRLVGLLLEDWNALGLARRARGVADRGRIRRFLVQAGTLLVFAVRRGGKLATAMEARGFGGTVRRSWARRSVLRARDVAFMLVGAAVVAGAVAAAVLLGTWRWVL